MVNTSDDDLLRTLDLTIDVFDRSVSDVGAAQWDLPSPCAGWSVRDVVDHVVVGDRYGTRALEGLPLDAAIEGLVGLGDDPDRYLDEVRAAAQSVRAAFNGSLDRPLEHPVGAITARRYLHFRIIDVLGHAWDVATATTGSLTADPLAVQVAFAAASEEAETLAKSANFDVQPNIAIDPNDPLTGFLLLIGRTPS